MHILCLSYFWRCFLKNTKCSARLNCRQIFWAWDIYSEELKHPPGFYSIGIYRHFVWGGNCSLFWFLCFRRCFPRKRHSSANLHCQQPFWAWENYYEELKHPPPFFLLVYAQKFAFERFFISPPVCNVVCNVWGFFMPRFYPMNGKDLHLFAAKQRTFINAVNSQNRVCFA